MKSNIMSNKCIYQPRGAAREYSRWACNLYNGCSHNCQYCYCKRGYMAHTIGKDKPTLKVSLGMDEEDAYRTFAKELREHRQAILDDGGELFFSFSTDPMLCEEIDLTMRCVQECVVSQVPVQILTKATCWLQSAVNEPDEDDSWLEPSYLQRLCAWRRWVRLGVTLTGHDELEPDAPSNADRIVLLNHLQACGIRTFASIEPVVDFASSLKMILDSLHYTAEYRIGLMSPVGQQHYDYVQCERFCRKVTDLSSQYGFTVMWKQSIRKFYEKRQVILPEGGKR